MSGTCDDLTAAADRSEEARVRRRWSPIAGRGQECAGTIDGTVGLASLQARAIDAADLLPTVRNAGAGLVTHEAPKYMYDLLQYWNDGVPNGGTVDGTAAATSALVEHYNGMGSTSADGLLAGERLIGWVPGRGSADLRAGAPGSVPVDRDPLRVHRSGMGTIGRAWWTPSTAVSTPAVGSAHGVQGRDDQPGHLVRWTDRHHVSRRSTR